MKPDRFRLSDISKVRGMFCEAFGLDCYSESRFVMRHLLDHYLCGYLMESDYAITVRNAYGVEGFLLGCTQKRKGKPVYRFLRAYHRIFLPFSHGGRGYIRCKRLIERADAAMRREAPVPESELILFVVRPESRGGGVGRGMLMVFRDWLVENNVKSMQLFTDDYCDVDYYRRRGYVQLGKRRIEFMPGVGSWFYLFTIAVDRIGVQMK